jgi:hypothetical protein
VILRDLDGDGIVDVSNDADVDSLRQSAANQIGPSSDEAIDVHRLWAQRLLPSKRQELLSQASGALRCLQRLIHATTTANLIWSQ